MTIETFYRFCADVQDIEIFNKRTNVTIFEGTVSEIPMRLYDVPIDHFYTTDEDVIYVTV